MYTVLLVDDEIWSLEGLSKLFAWEKSGFTVIAQTTDASEAFEIICKEEPDVVFTDIRMPDISGIELLNRAREVNARSEFVVVSGYAEFEYAQEAVRYHAYDYQLKPIDPIEGNLLLERLKIHLDKKGSMSKRNKFKAIFSGLNDPMDVFKTMNFTPCGEQWQVVTFLGMPYDDCKTLLSTQDKINYISFEIDMEKTIVLLNGSQSLREDSLSFFEEKQWGENSYIGLSSVTHDISNISELLKEADMAACNYFINKDNHIVSFSADRSTKIENAIRKIEKQIFIKNFDEIRELIDDIITIFEEEQRGVYHATYLWNQCATMISKRLDGASSTTRIDFSNHEALLGRFDNLSEMSDYIKTLFKEICFPVNTISDEVSSYNQNFIALLEYVTKNYTDQLVLRDLAEQFYLNMSYCSELFKKVTGYTFSDYVTKLRMEKAAELLQSDDYKIHKVWEMTGYNDYYYFCKVFKGYHGVTPSHFKKKMTELLSNNVI